MIKNMQSVAAVIALLLISPVVLAAEPEGHTFHGVVTYHLIPAKVIRVNAIIKDPEPGTSYIGEKSILVELDKNIDLRSNWTVVDVEYEKYPQTKVIRYEVLGDQYETRVDYHATSVVIDGNISEYIKQ